MKHFKDKLKAIKAILKAEEYFVAIANKNDKNKDMIFYEYFNNTDRDEFYIFIKKHVNNKIKKDILKF